MNNRELPTTFNANRDNAQSQSVSITARDQIEVGAPTNISENAVPASNVRDETIVIDAAPRAGSQRDMTSLSAAQTQINQFPDETDNIVRVGESEIEEGEAGFGRAERAAPGEMAVQDHAAEQNVQEENGNQNYYVEAGIDGPNDLPAPQSQRSL